MSLMNLQKLRQICYRDESNHPVMEITLPPNDPLTRVEFTDKQGNNHSAQAHAIHCNSSTSKVIVAYYTEEDINDLDVIKRTEFNHGFGGTFLPRLNQILVEHGFHSGYLPYLLKFNDHRFVTIYMAPQGFINQIIHACYDDGRSMRAAVEFQAKLNKT